MSMTYFAGIDIGSLTTEVVILDSNADVLSYSINLTGADCNEAVDQALGQALSRAGLSRDQLSFIVATGYGRVTIPFSDKKITEISCHGTSAHHLFPDTETVIDIGGQDSKIIEVDSSGRRTGFKMNRKCAAGTGAFLEEMSNRLKVDIEQFNSLAKKSRTEVQIGSYLAEDDIERFDSYTA